MDMMSDETEGSSTSSFGDQPVQPRKQRPYKPKVKTGCTTCRIRRIKCDEGKPQCQKCVRTGRICDGYAFTIRQKSYAPQRASGLVIIPRISESSFQPPIFEGTPDEIEVLGQYWKFKDDHGLKNGYEEVAQESLHTSLSEPAVRHALVATGSLAATFAGVRGKSSLDPSSTPDFSYSLQQYSKAMVHLAERLGKPDHASRKVALICCRQFIAIETIQNNYSLMVMHLIRGLKIMYECHARPGLDEKGNLVRAGPFGLLLPDTFIINLFSAPFPPTQRKSRGSSESSGAESSFESKFEKLLHKAREKLLPISIASLDFLDRVSEVTTSSAAHALLENKAQILAALEKWFLEFEPQLTLESGPEQPLPRASYLLLNHAILKDVIMIALNASLQFIDDLRISCLKSYSYAEILTAVNSPSQPSGRGDSSVANGCESDAKARSPEGPRKAVPRVPLDMGWAAQDPKFSDSSKRWLVLMKWLWRDRSEGAGG